METLTASVSLGRAELSYVLHIMGRRRAGWIDRLRPRRSFHFWSRQRREPRASLSPLRSLLPNSSKKIDDSGARQAVGLSDNNHKR